MTRLFGLSSLFFTFLRKLLFLWVRTDVINGSARELGLDPAQPVVYVLQHSALSSRLVLEQECRRLGLPSAQQPLTIGGEHLRRSFFFLYGRRGQMFRRRQSPILTARLKQLVHAVNTDASLDVQIVPVTLLWGRAPDKERSLFKLLLSDPWAVAGRLQKLLIILIHGRNTFVQFNKPISLRQVTSTVRTEELATRKLARILRVHFRRVRQAVIGPDLSHRRTLVQSLIKSPVVKDAIRETAKRDNIPPAKARDRALKYADEIASNVSVAGVRFLDILLTRVWNRIYDGVRIHNIEAVQEVAKENAIVYVPCHRSHIDYLLLSYLLFRNSLTPPHIAAGINLNMPVIGNILRRGGAFFMRRSFRGNQLYTAVFNEYLHLLFSRGFPVEYFIEGGRSRTGRLLDPRTGMLAITLRSYLRSSRRPIVFMPVYIGYERVLEGRTYLGELRGQAKKKESIFDLFRVLSALKLKFGEVTVNFGEPVALTEFLDRHQPAWRLQRGEPEYRPDWLPEVTNRLARTLGGSINAAADANPVNLVALVMLSTRRLALDEATLARTIDTFTRLLRDTPYSPNVTLAPGSGMEQIRHVESMGMIGRQSDALGEILYLDEPQAVLLTWYRNNILHLVALPALIASLFLNNARMNREQIERLVSALYPYLQGELFMHWQDEDLPAVIQRYVDGLIGCGLLLEEGGQIHRPDTASSEFVLLTLLARSIIQMLERFYMVAALLLNNPNGSLTAEQLESLCTVMAQRLSILHGLNAPEFFDKTLFRQFIQRLLDEQVLSPDEEGRLHYLPELEDIAENTARRVLSAEIRLSIRQVARSAG